jgi:hypothetical protein
MRTFCHDPLWSPAVNCLGVFFPSTWSSQLSWAPRHVLVIASNTNDIYSILLHVKECSRLIGGEREGALSSTHGQEWGSIRRKRAKADMSVGWGRGVYLRSFRSMSAILWVSELWTLKSVFSQSFHWIHLSFPSCLFPFFALLGLLACPSSPFMLPVRWLMAVLQRCFPISHLHAPESICKVTHM